MEAKVHSLLEKHNLLSFEREVLDNLIPCLYLQLEKSKELPLGGSKMGGFPIYRRDAEFHSTTTFLLHSSHNIILKK